MVVPDTVPPCPWGVIIDLRDSAEEARSHYDLGEYGSALVDLALMNAELRELAGWCVPESSDAPLGNQVGRILARSKTLMYSIELEWIESGTGASEAADAISFAATTPAQGDCRMAVLGPAGVEATITVYDVAGRTVSTVYDGPLAEGGTIAVWDGTDSEGNRVGSGVYFARVVAGEERAVQKIVLVR
jgi:hypothetical protein